jgi:hypothetical protein
MGLQQLLVKVSTKKYMSATVYKCDQCGETFNSVNDLEGHRRNEHIKPATEDRFTSNAE